MNAIYIADAKSRAMANTTDAAHTRPKKSITSTQQSVCACFFSFFLYAFHF